MLFTEGVLLLLLQRSVKKYFLILAMAQHICTQSSIEGYIEAYPEAVRSEKGKNEGDYMDAYKANGSDYAEQDYGGDYEYKDEPTNEGGYLDPEKCLCGRQDVHSADQATRIVGGKESVENEFPWKVSLERTSSKEHKCGASLISPLHLLTAAHCVIQPGLEVFRAPDIMTAVVGVHDIHADKEGKMMKIKEVHVYPNVTWTTLKKDLKYDVAILELEKEVKLTAKVLPICLPGSSSAQDYADGPKVDPTFSGEKAVIAGWGRVRQVIAGDPSMRSLGSRLKMDPTKKRKKRAKRSVDRMSEEKGTLRRATVDLITNEDCKQKLEGRFKVKSVHLCAFTPGVDACQGDSGGPASLASADGRHTQVGIVSLGAGCGDYRFPALYTRVTKIMDWIKKVTANYTVWDSNCNKL